MEKNVTNNPLNEAHCDYNLKEHWLDGSLSREKIWKQLFWFCYHFKNFMNDRVNYNKGIRSNKNSSTHSMNLIKISAKN